MHAILWRFVIGGFVVSAFAILGDMVKPKSFAGLFGAAPSIALATIALTVAEHGKHYAGVEARSMILGAIAFLVYASAVCTLLLRKKWPVLPVTAASLLLWLGCAVGLWYGLLG